MKVYIATSLERAAVHNELRDLLAAEDIGVTYDWTVHGSVRDTTPERIAEVAELELDGATTADAGVVLLPGGRGTHTELGMTLAMSKRVFLHHETGAGVFELGRETCAFYWHPLVVRSVGPISGLARLICAHRNLVEAYDKS